MLRHNYPMKKLSLLLLAACLLLLSAPAANAWDLFQQYEKVILIDQPRQMGTAYEDGRKLREFPVLTGDDECTTYSMFFDWPRRKAIHEGGVPPRSEKTELATHGCIHVEQPDIEWLYNWADAGATAVVILGWRSGD